METDVKKTYLRKIYSNRIERSDNMYLVEYVTSFIYKLEDVKRELFPDCETAREFIIAKQNDMTKGEDVFFLLKFKEMK